MNNDKTKQAQWTEVAVFPKEPANPKGPLVSVQQSDHHPSPRFSMRVGQLGTDNRTGKEVLKPFINVRIVGKGKRELDLTYGDVFSQMAQGIQEAEQFILERSQQYEDDFIAEKQKREARRDHKPKERPGLKKLGALDAKAKGFEPPTTADDYLTGGLAVQPAQESNNAPCVQAPIVEGEASDAQETYDYQGARVRAQTTFSPYGGAEPLPTPPIWAGAF